MDKPPFYQFADVALQAARQFIFSVKRQPVDKRKENVIPAILGYCAAWNVPFFRKIQDQLPREIRDIIYGYLWDDEGLRLFTLAMSSATIVECQQDPISCHDIVHKAVAPTIRSCSWHARQPFFVKPGYVGAGAAREVVEAWYWAMRRITLSWWKSVRVDEAALIINNDAFLVGLDPASVLRELDVEIYIDYPYPLSFEMKERFLGGLLRIKQKCGFKLTISLKQRFIKLNRWCWVFNDLHPILAVYEREGADVRVDFVYDNHALKPRLELDVLPWLRDPDQDWKEEARAFFDSQPHRLRQRHRLYKIENNDDFEPWACSDWDDEYDDLPDDVLDSYHSDRGSDEEWTEDSKEPWNQFSGTLMVLNHRWNEQDS